MIGKKTAFVIHSLKIGGSEKFFVALVNGLYDEGHDLMVILLEDQNPELRALRPGVEVAIIPRAFRFDLQVSWRIREMLLQRKVQQVFCVEPYSFFIARLASYADRNIKFFLSLHNSLPIGTKKFILDLIYLRTFRRADHAAFICEAQRNCYRTTYYFTPEVESVIYNGVDTDHFSPAASLRELEPEQFHWRQELGIKDNDKVLLMVGRISPEKAHHLALLALRQLHQRTGLRAHIVIAGSGNRDLELALRQQVSNLQLGSYVHFLGIQRELRPFLLMSDGFLMTSVSETFSLAALEALSMGLPCLLTDVGGATEMIIPGCGVLSKSGDVGSIAASMEQLLELPFNRQGIRRSAIDRFSFRLMIDQYRSLLGYKAVEHECG